MRSASSPAPKARLSSRSGAQRRRVPADVLSRPSRVAPRSSSQQRVAVVAAVVPRDRRVASEPGGRRRKRVHCLVGEPGVDEPVDDLVPAVAPRNPRAAPDRHGETARPACMQLVGDLAAGLAAADDQDRSLGQLRGTLVLARVQLEVLRRECCARAAVGVGSWYAPVATTTFVASQELVARLDLERVARDAKCASPRRLSEPVPRRTLRTRRGTRSSPRSEANASGSGPSYSYPGSCCVHFGVFR